MGDSSHASDDRPLFPASPSPDEMYPSYYEAHKKFSKIRKFFCSQTGLFLVLGLLLLAVVTVLLVTGLVVVPNVATLPTDPLPRARALLKQSPLIDGLGSSCALCATVEPLYCKQTCVRT